MNFSFPVLRGGRKTDEQTDCFCMDDSLDAGGAKGAGVLFQLFGGSCSFFFQVFFLFSIRKLSLQAGEEKYRTGNIFLLFKRFISLKC